MKIIYLSACGKLGGAERSLVDMLASIRAHRPDCSLQVVATEDGPLVSACRGLGISATVVNLPSKLAQIGDAAAGGPAGRHQSLRSIFSGLILSAPALVNYLRKLHRVLRGFEPDVIHSNGFKMHVLAAIAAPRHIPIVWHLHDYVSARPMMAGLLRCLSRSCAIAIANSESVAADVRTVCGSALPVQTIYNAVDLETFAPSGPALELNSQEGMPRAETIRIGMLATLARWKGHETFLRAVSLMPRDLPLRAYVMGDALYQTNGSQHSLEGLKALANKLGISDRVEFTGFVDQPAAAMRALDIVVHASTEREPFGLVIAEAMACRKPVVVADGAGATELISLGEDALSHVPGDAEGLANCLVRLSSDTDLRAKIGNAARLTAERSFDRKRLASELVPLYRRLLIQKSEIRGQRSEPAAALLTSTPDF